jgi:site-specific DNA-cytosine methylase
MELWSLRNPQKNSTAAEAFSGMSWSQITEQMRTLVAKQDTILAHAGDQQNTLHQRLQHMETLVTATDALQGTLSDTQIEGYLQQWSQAQAKGAAVPPPPFDVQQWWQQQVAKLMAAGKSEEEAQAMVAGLAKKLGFALS